MLNMQHPNCADLDEAERGTRERSAEPASEQENHFDVPGGYLPRREALLQILVLPGAIGTAGILIALIAIVAGRS